MTREDLDNLADWLNYILTHGSKRHEFAMEAMRLARVGMAHEEHNQRVADACAQYQAKSNGAFSETNAENQWGEYESRP